MRYNSSNIAWIGCYMVKLLSPYCLHFYVLIGSIQWGLWKENSWNSKSSTLEVYGLISKESKFFHTFRCIFCYEIFIVFSFSFLCLVRVYFLIENNCFWFLHFLYSIFYIIFCQHSLNNDYSWHLHSVIVIGFGAVWYKCGLCLGLLPIKFHIKNYHSVSCSTSGGCNIHLLLQSTF